MQEFLLKLPDEEASARLRDNLLQALHLLQLYYRDLQKRDKESDPLQWTIDHSLSPLTPFKEAPDKFDWQWINADSTKARQSLTRTKTDLLTSLPSLIVAIRDGDISTVKQLVKEGIKRGRDRFSRFFFKFFSKFFSRPQLSQSVRFVQP